MILLIPAIMFWVCFPFFNLPYTMATDPREAELKEIMKQRSLEPEPKPEPIIVIDFDD
jgi:hypothetical protein